MEKTVSRKLIIYSLFFSLMIANYHWNTNYVKFEGQFISFDILSRWSKYLGQLAMSYFFFTSGYLLYRNASKENWKRKVKSRLYSLLLPSMLWSLITYICVYWRNPFYIMSLTDFFKGIITEPFDGPLWTMIAFLSLLVFFPFCVRCRWLLLAIPFARYLNIQSLVQSVWWGENCMFYLPAYCLGGFLGTCKVREIVTRRQQIISAAVYLLIIIYHMSEFSDSVTRRYLLLITPVFVWGLIRDDVFKKDPSFPFTVSFFIYAMHAGRVMPFIKREILPYFPEPGSSGAGLIILRVEEMIMTYCIILMFAYLMKTLLPDKLFKVLSGGRI